MFKYFILMMSMWFVAGCGLQSIPQAKNDVEASVAEVTNQYKRRADLIPNLVQSVAGYAKTEKETLIGVVNARANATSAKIDASNLTPEQLAKFQQAQGSLSQALGKLMVVVEKYPELKANQGFLDLQAQLEGTENRIVVARNRYIESIKNFNNLITVPPTSFTNSLYYKHDKMPQWDVTSEEKEKIEQAPNVTF